VGSDAFQVTNAETGAVSTVKFVDVSRLAATNLLSGDTVQYGGGVRAKLVLSSSPAGT
jgi:hypothetical protein